MPAIVAAQSRSSISIWSGDIPPRAMDSHSRHRDSASPSAAFLAASLFGRRLLGRRLFALAVFLAGEPSWPRPSWRPSGAPSWPAPSWPEPCGRERLLRRAGGAAGLQKRDSLVQRHRFGGHGPRQGGVGLAVGHVGAEAAGLHHDRLAGFRILAERAAGIGRAATEAARRFPWRRSGRWRGCRRSPARRRPGRDWRRPCRAERKARSGRCWRGSARPIPDGVATSRGSASSFSAFSRST